MPAYGIDVSHWQGVIDWNAVKRAGKQFALIKASEGTGWVDDQYQFNRREAEAAGLKVAPYHYFRPGWNSGDQAQHFFDTVGKPQPGDLIPWLDVEDFGKTAGGPDIAAKDFVYQLSQTLVKMDELFGCTVGIYTGLWFWDQLPVTWSMDDRPLWVAYWYSDQKPGNPVLPQGWTQYAVHQYTSKGTVAGISGAVDLDWIPGSMTDIQVPYDDDPENWQSVLQSIDIIRNELDAIEKEVTNG